jgi:hypothetical protein
MRAIRSDWAVPLPDWDGELMLRLVSDQLTDGKLIRIKAAFMSLSRLAVISR